MFIDISPNDWAFAALIGEARRRSNENKRNNTRDRGNEKNIHVDLMGSLGEVLAYKLYKNQMKPETAAKFVEDFCKTEGGAVMQGADMRLDIGESTLDLDIKTYDCAPNKRFFAINSKKHAKLSDCCDGYLCILFPKYGRKAYVVNNVPYDHVSNWEQKALGGYGDPSYNLPISSFASTYGEQALVHKLVQEGAYTRDEIRNAIYSEPVMNRFLELVPQASDLFMAA